MENDRIAVISIGVEDYELILSQTLDRLMPGHQLLERRKLRQSNLPFQIGKKVMLIKCITVGTVRKRHIEHLGLSHGLLQAERHSVLVVLGFDNGNRVIRIYIKDIIGLLGLFTEHKIALEFDFAVRDFCFHRNAINVPFCSDCRSNEL